MKFKDGQPSFFYLKVKDTSNYCRLMKNGVNKNEEKIIFN